MRSKFVAEYTGDGCLTVLKNAEDSFQMNWVSGQYPWGTVQMPEGMQVCRSHRITEKDTVEESFVFSNATEFPIYIKEAELGIITQLADRYEDAKTCMEERCHTHIWCGKEAFWIKAVRMSGIGPHLGVGVKKGAVRSYSVLRNEANSSNDRGSFLLHPDIDMLLPNETYEIVWELFWFNKQEQFAEHVIDTVGIPVVELEQATYLQGENASFAVRGKGTPSDISITSDMEVNWKLVQEGAFYKIIGEVSMKLPGEHKIDIAVDNIHTSALLYCSPRLEDLVHSRCKFIAEKQQETVGALKGAYLIYDRETGRRYYSHRDDHNGGRERVAMGTLMALWLQTHEDARLEESLKDYISYVYRELFDDKTGDVYNDINRNHDWDRLYNYPWAANFLMEVYKWSKQEHYLVDGYKALMRYYEKDGKNFYAIGIPAKEMLDLLEKTNHAEEVAQLKKQFLLHADCIAETGLDFPKSEVNYEQSIVAPAVSVLQQAYEISADEKYKAAAEKIMAVLELFNGQQPDYHMFENAIRHWDGYWFGKRRCFGDTFPHYWSVLTGVEYLAYGRKNNAEDYMRRGRASLRGCLNLFAADGNASCVMVYPKSINGKDGCYYDPWANDQDWALYYAYKYGV